MRHVSQKDFGGCGPACLAMVSGKSYEEAKRLLSKDPQRFVLRGVGPKPVVKALKRVGVDCFHTRDFRYLLVGRNIKAAIISFEILGTGVRHYVVWDPKRHRFLDPACPKWRAHFHTTTYLQGLKKGAGIIVVP